jgi:cephalosporin hydroxylase
MKNLKHIDIKKVVEGTFAFGTIQNYNEIYPAVEFLLKQNITNFLEIGTNQGGTFYCWTCISNHGIRISVDIPHGNFSAHEFDEIKRNKILSGYPGYCHFISGDSHEKSTLVEVENLLKGEKLDFIFIDGDHTEEGVTQDFLMYKDLVKDGGWIGFHDIKSSYFHHTNNCFVDKLWSKLNGDKVEFIDNSNGFGGIGLIQNNSKLIYKN